MERASDVQATGMKFKAALTTQADVDAAVREIRESLNGVQPDLALVFISRAHGPDFEDIYADLREAISARNLIGCIAEGVIGPKREVEDGHAISVWAARMPGVRTLPFVIDQNDVGTVEDSAAWQDHLGVKPEDQPSFIILPDPFSIDVEQCLEELDQAYPGATIVGGMSSGARNKDESRLFLNDQVLRQGLVGVSLCGPVKIETVVSQGCRPVGEPFVITKCDRNIIQELRGTPAVQVVQQLYRSAAPGDQALMEKGLHIGQVIDERLAKFGPGDFLIRNLMGVVNDTGLAITALVRPGQTVQFHVRDSASADSEMKNLLAGKIGAMPAPPTGGLLFSCNGRGHRMFGSPNHDIGVINHVAGGCEVAGFFAAGEIGPVGNKTFIHGFTSSVILFRSAGS